MVFAVGAGNDYRGGVGPQSIENATAELRAARGNDDMRLWMVPSPAGSRATLRAGANLLRNSSAHGSSYVAAHGRSTYVGAGGGALTNLTGGCNTTLLCHNRGDPLTEGCDNECMADDESALTHMWTPVSTESVGALSAVCYLAARDIRRLQAAQNPGRAPRPVGLLASYVGGTPVGCWASDHDADATCAVVKSREANFPCDPTQACCPGKLFDDKVAPLTAFNIRAALWYQGEGTMFDGDCVLIVCLSPVHPLLPIIFSAWWLPPTIPSEHRRRLHSLAHRVRMPDAAAD